MAIRRSVEIKVCRKISSNYNSTSYAVGVTLELTEAEARVPNKVPALIQEWSEKLRDSIRQEFSRSNSRA